MGGERGNGRNRRERERKEEGNGALFVVSETDREIVIRVAERGKRAWAS